MADKEKARNRLAGYRDSDPGLRNLATYTFCGKGAVRTPAVRGYWELYRLLGHFRDPGVVADFLLDYHGVLMEQWGQQTTHNLQAYRAFNGLTAIVPGTAGPSSFIAVVPSYAAFLDFKRCLQLETATHFVQASKSNRECLSWYEFRCHRGPVVKANVRAKEEHGGGGAAPGEATARKPKESGKAGCSAKMVVRVPIESSCGDHGGSPAGAQNRVTIEMELGHEAHTPGSEEDMLWLPVDDRIISKIRELSLSSDGRGGPMNLRTIREASASGSRPPAAPVLTLDFIPYLLQLDGIQRVAKSDRRFHPDDKCITNHIALARKDAQLLHIRGTLEVVRKFLSRCPQRLLPRLLEKLDPVRGFVEDADAALSGGGGGGGGSTSQHLRQPRLPLSLALPPSAGGSAARHPSGGACPELLADVLGDTIKSRTAAIDGHPKIDLQASGSGGGSSGGIGESPSDSDGDCCQRPGPDGVPRKRRRGPPYAAAMEKENGGSSWAAAPPGLRNGRSNQEAAPAPSVATVTTRLVAFDTNSVAHQHRRDTVSLQLSPFGGIGETGGARGSGSQQELEKAAVMPLIGRAEEAAATAVARGVGGSAYDHMGFALDPATSRHGSIGCSLNLSSVTAAIKERGGGGSGGSGTGSCSGRTGAYQGPFRDLNLAAQSQGRGGSDDNCVLDGHGTGVSNSGNYFMHQLMHSSKLDAGPGIPRFPQAAAAAVAGQHQLNSSTATDCVACSGASFAPMSHGYVGPLVSVPSGDLNGDLPMHTTISRAGSREAGGFMFPESGHGPSASSSGPSSRAGGGGTGGGGNHQVHVENTAVGLDSQFQLHWLNT
eukprot:SM000161S02417  [mRNA]  locus=s161:168603:172575:+ [translate_table: standard]